MNARNDFKRLFDLRLTRGARGQVRLRLARWSMPGPRLDAARRTPRLGRDWFKTDRKPAREFAMRVSLVESP